MTNNSIALYNRPAPYAANAMAVAATAMIVLASSAPIKPIYLVCFYETKDASSKAEKSSIQVASLPSRLQAGGDTTTPATIQPTSAKNYALHKLRNEKSLIAEGKSVVKLKTLISTENFLELLSDLGAPIPNMMIASDGEVTLHSRKQDIYIDIGFMPDGTYSYFVKDSDGQEYMDDDLYPSYGLPAPLHKVLSNIAAI